jgi:hypothetical protein
VPAESHRALCAVPLVLFVLAAAGCSSEKPVSVAPKSRDQAEYVSGIAVAYYCTCDEWPASWNELSRFDDYLHARSAAAGEPPLKRFAWSDINASVFVHSDGSFIVAPKSDAHLEKRGGAAAKADDEDFDPIAVPAPDCTRFDRVRFASGCARAAKLSRH